jgi:hypothetical protein
VFECGRQPLIDHDYNFDPTAIDHDYNFDPTAIDHGDNFDPTAIDHGDYGVETGFRNVG